MSLKIWVFHIGKHNDGEPNGHGMVKIKLKLNENLAVLSGGTTDEGYSYTRKVYRWEASGIHRYTQINSRDCDGPLNITQCDVVQRLEWDDELQGRRPTWHTVDYEREDVYAQAMGY